MADLNDMPLLPDTGDRSAFDTGAVRDASIGKGMPSCIPPEAIRRLAQRFEDGARKYSANNWMKGIPLSRYVDAIVRHTLAAAEGKQDEDHLGAVMWNAAAWIWTQDAIASGKLPDSLNDLPYWEAATCDASSQASLEPVPCRQEDADVGPPDSL